MSKLPLLLASSLILSACSETPIAPSATSVPLAAHATVSVASVTSVMSGLNSPRGEQTRIVTGLPSTYIVHSAFASGPQDISFLGRGRAMVAMGWGGDPWQRGVLAQAALEAGTLVQLEPSGKWKVVADISAFEQAANPAGHSSHRLRELSISRAKTCGSATGLQRPWRASTPCRGC